MRIIYLACLLMTLSLLGCEGQRQQEQVLQPVAFHSGDECHVCGMAITRFPGPKGEALGGQPQGVKKFCSAAEMLSWYRQPENRQANFSLYVHDMGKSEWDMPDDAHLIDAKVAFYVPAPTLPGAMGMPLASYADRQAAQAFATQHKTQVLTLEQAGDFLEQQQHAGHHGHH